MSNPIRDALVELLHEARGTRSLRVAAGLAGIDFTYLSKIENGHDRPGRDLVVRLDGIYGSGGRLVAAYDSQACTKCGRATIVSPPSGDPAAALAWALHNQVVGCKYTEADEYNACPGPQYHDWIAGLLVKDIATYDARHETCQEAPSHE